MFLENAHISPVQKKVLDNWPDKAEWFTCKELNDIFEFKVRPQTLNTLQRIGYLIMDDREWMQAYDSDQKLDVMNQVKYSLVPRKGN